MVPIGYADNPVVADFQAHDFSSVLNKPYRLEELEECLNTLLSFPDK